MITAGPPGDDILVLIQSCAQHSELQETIRQTWVPEMQSMGARCFFVVGDDGGRTRIEADRLYVQAPDTYEHLVLKVLLSMAYVHEHLAADFRYVFKVDDDCYVQPRRLLSLPFRRSEYSGRVLQVHKVAPNARWHIGKCQDKDFERPYGKPYRCNMATGIGYFIRTDLLGHLAAEAPTVRSELAAKQFDFEDKRIAETLYDAGIDATPLDGYAAVFLAKGTMGYSKEWRVHISEPHRFVDYDVITDCTPSEMQMVHQWVARQKRSKQNGSARAVSAD